MHGMGDERPIRIAAFKRNGNFRAFQQRKMKTVHLSGVRSGKAHQRTFKTCTFLIEIKIELHPIAASSINPTEVCVSNVKMSRVHSCMLFALRELCPGMQPDD